MLLMMLNRLGGFRAVKQKTIINIFFFLFNLTMRDIFPIYTYFLYPLMDMTLDLKKRKRDEKRFTNLPALSVVLKNHHLNSISKVLQVFLPLFFANMGPILDSFPS